ncbi:MAG TPA: glycosyl hydrolase family 65 protein, partial [Thermoanaerobaculia bacterium]|nr:glycosyl hydrolase family 65 protein [Thermoanaerobaculia bacterium]
RGATLHLDPCIPRAWSGFEIEFRYGAARYQIKVENPDGAMKGIATTELDGESLAAAEVPLIDDGERHVVRVVLG